MSIKRNIKSDVTSTNAILKDIENGVEVNLAVSKFSIRRVNWLGHALSGGTHRLDTALLLGATIEDLGKIRGAIPGHILHLKQEHGLSVECRNSLYKIVRTKEFIEPIVGVDYAKINELADSIDMTDKQPIGQLTPNKISVSSSCYERDVTVVAAVLNEADGTCELCGSKSFQTLTRRAFLEVHHLKFLSDGGSDRLSNVVALCPTCHKELHFGIRANNLKERLYNKIPRLIRE